MISAFIAGCAGTELTENEKSFFRERAPAGFILFERNVSDPDQLRALVESAIEARGNDEMLVLIDQEGGRVQRMVPPHWRQYPAAMEFAHLADGDEVRGREALALVNRAIARDLRACHINMNCTPVLDVPVEGAHDIIGNRAYGWDAETIARRARIVAETSLACGVLPVIKHIPGHGRSTLDSHKALPVVDAPLSKLEKSDFLTFRRLNDMPAAMTAHIVYSAIDAHAPASTSERVIRDIVRGHIGFDGLLMSDDLSMHALQGSMSERTRDVIAAGCDLALHCNGDFGEMCEVADNAPELTGEGLVRFMRAMAHIKIAEPQFGPEEEAKLETLLAEMRENV